MFGKKIDVIKYEGPADVFVWKHESEDFNTKSQLIVHESQEAIFFKNGQALDTFQAGRYTLDTQNRPFLRRIVEAPTGGVTPFHCEVYYVNKAVSMGLDWGTDSPIAMEDPEYGLPISVRAYGDFSLRVTDGRKLLVKLVGTLPQFTHEEIRQYFKGIVARHARDCIANTLEKNKIGALHVDRYLNEISAELLEQLNPIFTAYGLEVNHFSVQGIIVSGLEEIGQALRQVRLETIAARGESDIARMRIHVDAERIQAEGAARNAVKLGEGSVEAQINLQKGITEQQKQAFDVAKTLAGNSGPEGAVAGSPIIGVGGSVESSAGMASEIVKVAIGHPQPQTQFSSSAEQDTFGRRLDNLKMLYDRGMITEEAYRAKVDEIMNSI